MYKEQRKLCRMYESKDGALDATSLNCANDNSGWETFGRVQVTVPNISPGSASGGILAQRRQQELIAAKPEEECYLWTQKLIDMIKVAEDASGDRTEVLPTVGTRVPAETLALLPAVIDGARGVEEFEDWGYLELCDE